MPDDPQHRAAPRTEAPRTEAQAEDGARAATSLTMRETTGTGPDTGPDRARFGWLWRRYARAHRPLLFGALALMAVEGAVLGAVSVLMEPMFDRVFVAGSRQAMWAVGLAIFGLFALRAASAMGQRVMMVTAAERIGARLRRDLMGHLMDLDLAFHGRNPPGTLIERVQGDVLAVTQQGTQLFTGLGRDSVALVVLFGVAISVDPVWTLVALVGVPLVFAPAAIVQRFIRRRAAEARAVAAAMAMRLDEVFHGVAAIKLNRLEAYQSDRFARLARARIRAETRSEIGRATMPGMIDVITGAGFLAVLVYGGGEIIAGDKTIGEFMAFFTAMALAFDPIRRLGNLSGLAQTMAASLERVQALLGERPGVTSPAAPVPAAPGEIAFDDVHLTYGDAPALRGLSFTAEAGRTTALVGASGAGKTTVFNLVTRLVDPDRGRIALAGTPIETLDLADLRGLVSVVSQDTALFDDTLRENVVLGRDVTPERLREVLDAAFVSDFADALPQGLETPVGPRGSALSGGQRQRVAIARALLADAPILLLDEATSALDTRSERKVQAALDRLAEGRTTLVIAHRLSTVRGADRIVVMEAGRVVEQGSHAELMARGGAYAALHAAQFAPAAEEAT
ncbi:MAG: ABC transporter ATP-binding protein [Shimia sp.]